MDRTRILNTGEGLVVKFVGKGAFETTGITFEYLGDKPGDVVVVESGTVRFESCRFRGGKARAQFRLGSGLSLRGDSFASIRGCHFIQNDLWGLSV